MKALTICQPYASLIVRGDKRVENRTWPTPHRGRFYIHAGKSREWFDDDADLIREFGRMPPFGAVIGIADLVECIQLRRIEAGEFEKRYPWLRTHEHTEGPWCWVLANVTPIGPWPWRGAQGLFDIDDAAIDRLANKQLGIAEPTEARA